MSKSCLNNEFFKLDDPISCYIYGLLNSDGYLRSDGIRIEILSNDAIDIEHSIQNTGKWLKYERHRINRQPQTAFVISTNNCVKWFKINKFHFKNKYINTKLINSLEYKYMFLRGFADGDGTWYLGKTREFALSASYDFDWQSIIKLFPFNFVYHIKQRTTKKGHQSSSFRVVNKDGIQKIVNYLYQDNLHIGYTRKQQKAIEIYNSYKY